MRQVLFRGKRLDNGKWITGSLLLTDDNCNDPFKTKPIKKYVQIVVYSPNDWGMGAWEAIDVDPDSVGQFTGLYDKNNKEIYEGDILKEMDAEDYSKATGIPLDELVCHKGKIVSVMYDAPEFCFAPNGAGYRFLIHPNLFEVVGNIHDNPEMKINFKNK